MKLAQKPSRIIAATLGAGIFIALVPALPAQASDQPRASTAFAAVDDAVGASIAAKPSPGGTQVLVAKGDGWYLYADAASVASIKVSQVQVAGSVTPMTVVDCGWVTCSLYMIRAQTQWANYNVNLLGGGLIGLGAACALIGLMSGPAAPVVAIACGVEIGILGVFLLNALSHAAGDNGCLRIRYGALPTAFYDDHSRFCYNT